MSGRDNPARTEVSARRLGRAAPITAALIPIGLSVALFYFINLGGTVIGELAGWPRLINAVLGGALIVVYLTRAPARNDRIDLAVVLALLLFSVAGVASTFPRQSFDAVLGTLAFAAAFYVARDVMASAVGSRTTLATLRLASAIVTALVVGRAAAVNIEWVQRTGDLLPPVGLLFGGWPFGHPYDLVTLALMLFPSWLVGGRSKPRYLLAVLIGAPLAAIAILTGSRAVWLAFAIATLVVGARLATRVLRRQVRVDPRVLVGVGLVVLAGLVVLVGPILDRLLASATLEQRMEMWGSATQVWLDRPVTGHGPGTFPWLLQTTDHFAGNAIHPRHPDSALFQLLPEAGLLGLAAGGVMVAGVGIPLLARSKAATWAVGVFLFGGIGGNPTDFPFLVVTAMAWAAYALPRPESVPLAAPPRPVVRWASAALLGLIAVAVAATSVGALRYDAAVALVRDGDLQGAHRELDAAMALDPGMAIYARQRGIASLLLSKPAEAVTDLRHAAAINPNDDLTWRALAIAQVASGDTRAARASLDRALDLQRSDITNLLLSAAWDVEANDRASFEQDATEILLGWPNVVAAPGWDAIGGGGQATAELVDSAIERWLDGGDAPVPIDIQPFLLALMRHRSDVADMAEAASGLSPSLARAMRALYWCDADTATALSQVPRAERRSSTYWALRVQHSSEVGSIDRTAVRLYELAAFRGLNVASTQAQRNPLDENNSQGSVDAWGYRRVPISWPSQTWLLPSPQAGTAQWLLNPAAARAAIGYPEASASCD